jgi:hypothetical protein
VKKYFNLVFKVKGCGKLGNSVPKKWYLNLTKF